MAITTVVLPYNCDHIADNRVVRHIVRGEEENVTSVTNSDLARKQDLHNKWMVIQQKYRLRITQLRQRTVISSSCANTPTLLVGVPSVNYPWMDSSLNF